MKIIQIRLKASEHWSCGLPDIVRLRKLPVWYTWCEWLIEPDPGCHDNNCYWIVLWLLYPSCLSWQWLLLGCSVKYVLLYPSFHDNHHYWVVLWGMCFCTPVAMTTIVTGLYVLLELTHFWWRQFYLFFYEVRKRHPKRTPCPPPVQPWPNISD
jgi:hypothetical protein